MTRIVELEADGPKKLDAEDIDDQQGDVAVCQCGLSESFPFCDGTHRQTRDEAEDVRYLYEDDGTRVEVDRIVCSEPDE